MNGSGHASVPKGDPRGNSVRRPRRFLFLLLLAVLVARLGLAAENVAQQKAEMKAQEAARPFRATFKNWEGKPEKPDSLVFAVAAHDLRRPFCMPTIGALIPETKLRVERFVHKTRRAPDGREQDVSELTLLNTETMETATLVLEREQDIGAVAGRRGAR
jgi:hypothetical protein